MTVVRWLVLVSTILLIGFIAVDTVLPNQDLLLAERVLQFSFALAVMYVYWPEVVSSVGKKTAEHGDLLVLGIVAGQASTAGQALFVVVYRLAGSPPWLANADLLGLIVLGSIVASTLHILCPGAIGGMIPKRNRILAGFTVGTGAMLVLFLLSYRPDISAVVEGLRPYLADWFGTNGR